MPHGAGCLCGAVRIAIAAEPLATRTCWCRLCQYLSAGGGTVNAVFPAAAVTVQGEVRWLEGTADSGNHMERGFCPACGTPLFSKSAARPHLLIVRAGALDDPGLAAPEQTIWTSAAPRWAVFDSEVPQVEEQPPPIA
ncbi:MAG TPA: GFA family protein [Allosphingosinicella sp.]|jgi:hypothetical protein